MRQHRHITGSSRRFRCILTIFFLLVFIGSVTCAYALPLPDAPESEPDSVSDTAPPAETEPETSPAPGIPDIPGASDQPQENPAPVEPEIPHDPAEEPTQEPAADPAELPADGFPADMPWMPMPDAETVNTPATTAAVHSADELLNLLRQPQSRSCTVTLDADFSVVLDSPLFIAEGRSLNLDLHGHTLTLTGEREDTSSLLDAGGSLTIYDSSEEAKGKLRFENTLSGIRIHGTRAAFILTSGTMETGTNAKRAVLAVGGSMLTMAGGTIQGDAANAALRPEETADGGAVYLNGKGTSMQFVGGTIHNAAGWNGGAFYIGDGSSLMMRENLEEDGSSGIGAEILSCRAALHGGGIYIAPGGVAAITGKALLNNRAAGNGGAVAIEGGTLTLSGGQIAANTAGTANLFSTETLQDDAVPEDPENAPSLPASAEMQDAYGGGIWVGPNGTLLTNAAARSHNAQIEENMAPTQGGGIWADETASITLGGYGLVSANTAAGMADNVYPVNTESTPAFEIAPSDPQITEAAADAAVGEESITAALPISVEGRITAGTEETNAIDSYEKLQKALLESEKDIVLHTDIAVPLSDTAETPLKLPAGRTACLVLNGHTITADLPEGISLFSVAGSLKVCSSRDEIRPAGTIALGSGGSVFCVEPGASLQLDSVNLIVGQEAERGLLIEAAGRLQMNGGSITGSGVAENGGALYVKGNAAQAETTAALVNVTILGTQAVRGGAVAVNGGHVSLVNSLISGCSALRSESVRTGNGIGGGIVVESGALKVQSTQVIDCEAGSSGGALYLESGSVELTGGLISSCRAVEGSGGGIYAESGTLTLTDPDIRECTAAKNRTALYVTSFAEVTTETKE